MPVGVRVGAGSAQVVQECRGFGALRESRAALENWGSGYVTTHSPTGIQLPPAACKVGIWIL